MRFMGFCSFIPVVGLGMIAVLVSTSRAALVDVSHPDNLLAGQSVAVSTAFPGGLGVSTALIDDLAPDNGQDAAFIFNDADGQQRISITGFTGGFSLVRIFSVYGDPARRIATVTIRSSVSLTNSLNAGDYETLLGSFSPGAGDYLPYVGGVGSISRGYFQVPVSAGSNTRSLFLDFGAASGSGDRVYEVQAVPEVSGQLLAGLTLGLVVLRRPRRRTL